MKRLILIAALVGISISAAAQASTIPTQTVQVEVTFNDLSDNEDGFRVYRCAGVGCVPTAEIKALPANTTTFTDTITNDVGGASHTYGVSAYKGTAESAKATATILTPAILIVPNAPSGLIATVRGVTIQ